MVTRRKHYIDFDDLHAVSVECGACKTTVTMDMRRQDIELLSQCPSCATPFGNIIHALGSYRNVLKVLTGRKDHRVLVEVEALDTVGIGR